MHEAPDAATVRLPMVASNELFAVRAAGGSMDGGRAPIRDGDWCVLRWMRGAPVEAMRDRVVLVQSTSPADPSVPHNRAWLEQLAPGVPVYGPIPFQRKMPARLREAKLVLSPFVLRTVRAAVSKR